MGQATNYFSPDYFTARTRFRQTVEKAAGRLYTIALDAKGPNNEDLTIDVGWFGANHPKKVLLHSSGLHGVEGFAGSAIQLQLLDGLPKLPEDTALIITHVLNPYGMAWLRRFNENNVDLNRNFIQGEEYAGVPEKYPKLDSFLNPASVPSWDLFLARAGWIVIRNGFNSVKQAVAGGQYEYPRGLFFGGKHLQQGPERYHAFLAKHLSSAKQVIAIDVHTGLGKYAKDILLVENMHYATLREKFGDRVALLAPDKSAAYRVRGGMNEMLQRALPKASSYFVAQEFGTFGPLKVLGTLREENRWHHFGGGGVDHPTKQKLKEAFSPNDKLWRITILARGRELLNQAVAFSFAASS